MTEKDPTPKFDEGKPYIQVRDRATPHIAYHQGANLFDRKKIFVKEADFVLKIKAPPAPVVKTRDIAERRVGGNSKSIIGKLADKFIGAPAVAPANSAPPKGPGGRKPSAPVKAPSGVQETLKRAAKENATAAAAEDLAA